MKKDYMFMAVCEAHKAFINNEVPIGAVLVKNDKVIAKAYNKKEYFGIITKHAEIIAIEKAEKKLKNWRLDGCDLYVTLDPCPMCASAIKQARVSNVYSCLPNSFIDNKKIMNLIFKADNTNSAVNFTRISDNYSVKKLMQDFFKKSR